MIDHRSYLLPPVFLAAFLGGCHRPQENAPLPDPRVSVAIVRPVVLNGDVSASGRLLPREEVAVTSELSGYRVARVLAEEDGMVRAGQTLAQLDDMLLRSQIVQARAQLAQQEIAAERSGAEAGRVSGIDDKGVLSQEAIMQRRFAARASRAAVDVARAQLNDLQIRDRRLAIPAPASGRVLQRNVRPGDTSSAGTVLFTIARDNLVELYAEVPEGAMDRIAVGDPASVTLQSGEMLNGTVRLRGARVDDRTGLGIVRIALPVRSSLRPGGFARARFAGVSTAVLAVPERALQFDASGACLFTLDHRDRVHRVQVRTGRRANGQVELLAGPSGGTRVVLGGSAFLLEGDRVRVATGGRQ